MSSSSIQRMTDSTRPNNTSRFQRRENTDPVRSVGSSATLRPNETQNIHAAPYTHNFAQIQPTQQRPIPKAQPSSDAPPTPRTVKTSKSNALKATISGLSILGYAAACAALAAIPVVGIFMAITAAIIGGIALIGRTAYMYNHLRQKYPNLSAKTIFAKALLNGCKWMALAGLAGAAIGVTGAGVVLAIGAAAGSSAAVPVGIKAAMWIGLSTGILATLWAGVVAIARFARGASHKEKRNAYCDLFINDIPRPKTKDNVITEAKKHCAFNLEQYIINLSKAAKLRDDTELKDYIRDLKKQMKDYDTITQDGTPVSEKDLKAACPLLVELRDSLKNIDTSEVWRTLAETGTINTQAVQLRRTTNQGIIQEFLINDNILTKKLINEYNEKITNARNQPQAHPEQDEAEVDASLLPITTINDLTIETAENYLNNLNLRTNNPPPEGTVRSRFIPIQ